MLKWKRRVLRIGGSKAITLPKPIANYLKDEVTIYTDGNIMIIVPDNINLKERHRKILKLLEA